MSTRERPIPEDAPAKKLAERLRELRRAAGTPSYRDMGRAVFVKHNTLSRVASGKYVRWPCVEQYIDALNKVGGNVTEHEIRELRALWEEARRRHYDQVAAKTRAAAEKASAAGEHSLIMWMEPRTTQARAEREPESSQGSPAPSSTRQSLLGAIDTEADLVAALNDLVQEKRIDLRELRRPRLAHDFINRKSPQQDVEAWEVLTGRRAPTPDVVQRIIQEICGLSKSEAADWTTTLRRAQDAALINKSARAGNRSRYNSQTTSGEANSPRGRVTDQNWVANVRPKRPLKSPTDAQERSAERPPLWRRLLRLK
jgi:hypothetical protein